MATTMYDPLINSLSTEVLVHIDDAFIFIKGEDIGVISTVPKQLMPKTVIGFEKPTSSWDANTKIVRVLAIYDFFVAKSGVFINNKSISNQYV